VDTSSTQLGDVLESKKMTGLPLMAESYIDLLGLQAGVIPISSGLRTTYRFFSGHGGFRPGIRNGQRETPLFHGQTARRQESVQNGASIVPTLDSIEEFRLLTNSFNAEYGRFSGAHRQRDYQGRD